MDRWTRRVVLVAGGASVVLGLWAFLGPASFYARLAAFPPYNRHFIHDLGAFLAGMGTSLVVALVIADGLLVALWGGAVGSVLHGISHIEDRGIGGRSSDPAVFALLGVILVAAAVARTRARR